MFDKYGRAVADETERKALHRRYIIKNVATTIFYALCVAIIVEAVVFKDSIADEENDTFFIVFGITLLSFIIAAISAIVLAVKFRKRYRFILERNPTQDEMPEITEYRQNVSAAQNAERKSARPALLILIASVIAMVACITADIIMHPDSDSLTTASYVGIVIFAVGLFIYFIALFGFNLKNAGKTTTTDEQMHAIDEAQGRRHKYSTNNDGNIQSYKYIMPTAELRTQAEAIQSKYGKATLYSAIGSVVVMFVLILIVFSKLFFDFGIIGYAVPTLIAVVYLSVFFATLPFKRKLCAIDKKQKEILDATPEYAINLEIYNKYDKFGKVRGKTPLIAAIIAFAASLALAIALPDAAWSAFALIPIFVGLLIYNKFFSDLRKSVIPLEKQIDEIEKEKIETQVAEASEQSEPSEHAEQK